ncbi:helix-turn-helix domain-containing protein [Streptomyces pactum]|uniref:helix-turn-helix domain-containing protein n=1 Tax=Streptomyces pactum TaxID=68249 RepID=UPI0036FCC73F
MLGAIGLDDAEESAYRALVALGSAGVVELAERLTLAQEEAVRTLRGLERRGLAARSPARPGQWVAAPPGVALGALLNRHRRELERAERAAALLDKEYRTGSPAAHPALEVVTGEGPVAERFAQLRWGAAEEVCALVAGAVPAPWPPVGDGVVRRVVVERCALPAGPADGPGAGPGLRVAERLPSDLVIADRALAIVPLTSGGAEPAALVVHAGGLLDALMSLFEAVWAAAVPLRPGGATAACPADVPPDAPPDLPDAGHGPDGTDLAILSLLLAGLTDASAARQLELGLRTVQRRVKRLMDLVGVTTRLQLGWHAYERGWVSRPERPRPSGTPVPGASGGPLADAPGPGYGRGTVRTGTPGRTRRADDRLPGGAPRYDGGHRRDRGPQPGRPAGPDAGHAPGPGAGADWLGARTAPASSPSDGTTAPAERISTRPADSGAPGEPSA